jgi:hypothetical protein
MKLPLSAAHIPLDSCFRRNDDEIEAHPESIHRHVGKKFSDRF